MLRLVTLGNTLQGIIFITRYNEYQNRQTRPTPNAQPKPHRASSSTTNCLSPSENALELDLSTGGILGRARRLIHQRINVRTRRVDQGRTYAESVAFERIRKNEHVLRCLKGPAAATTTYVEACKLVYKRTLSVLDYHCHHLS